jgi:hypothetical protein
VRPLAPSRVDACNPLLQAHPTWARGKHEGREIPPLTPVSLWLPPPFALRLAPTHLGWGTRRQFTRRFRDPPGFETPTLLFPPEAGLGRGEIASLGRRGLDLNRAHQSLWFVLMVVTSVFRRVGVPLITVPDNFKLK